MTHAGSGQGRQESLCIVIPAYNESPSVGSVVREASAVLPGARIVVVDDGSSDDTAAVAEAAGAVVVTLPINLGIGGAVQAGYLYALRAGCEIAVQLDGDGQHEAGEIPRLIEPLQAGRADMAIGSRWLGRGSYRAPAGRRVGMRVLSRLVRWRSGAPCSDPTSGFRAVGALALSLFAKEYPTDFPEVETVVMACHKGLRVEEVPVSMRPRMHGRSSIAGLRSAYYMARVCLLLIAGQPRVGAEI